ncbi:hypothetical protein GCM10017786_59490 [Amycolatopsis deserti]|uniref:Uncharacterized protein n=1 Tax=Amycolatopsis deserti TaxID=185696 RepID=A0ABQ3JCD7_9PSEU|nr:hypothetical protein GCM10017786_59490 [Amycolatopsis deserti]
MQTIGYWDAWTVWWHGRSVASFELWSWPILAWGRLGKGLQFAGGLIVVLDLIGAERLRKAVISIRRARRETLRSFRRHPVLIVLLWLAGTAFAAFVGFTSESERRRSSPGWFAPRDLRRSSRHTAPWASTRRR